MDTLDLPGARNQSLSFHQVDQRTTYLQRLSLFLSLARSRSRAFLRTHSYNLLRRNSTGRQSTRTRRYIGTLHYNVPKHLAIPRPPCFLSFVRPPFCPNPLSSTSQGHLHLHQAGNSPQRGSARAVTTLIPIYRRFRAKGHSCRKLRWHPRPSEIP